MKKLVPGYINLYMETDEYKLDDLKMTSAPKITYSKQGFRNKKTKS